MYELVMLSHREYRRLLLALIKHTPRANRIGAPDEYPGGAEGAARPDSAAEYVIPTDVKRRAAHADALLRFWTDPYQLSAGMPPQQRVGPQRPMVMWITDATLRPRRPHRRTYKPHGRPRKNETDKATEAAFGAAIEEAIDQLVRLRSMKKPAARRLVAAMLLDRILTSTLDATWNSMDPATRSRMSNAEWVAVESARLRLWRVLTGK